MIGNWFGWVRLTRYEEMRNRYEACKANAQATIESLHETIDFADLRIKELEAQRDVNAFQSRQALAQLDEVAGSLATCMQERDSLKLQVEEALKASRTQFKPPRPVDLPQSDR